MARCSRFLVRVSEAHIGVSVSVCVHMQGEPVCATHRINVAQTLSPANLVARGSLEEL